MKFSYYPGCSLKGNSREFDESIQLVASRLGWTLNELPDWNCCGATSGHALHAEFESSLAGRNLRIADKMGDDLLTPCAACFSRLKAARKAADFTRNPVKILHLHHALSNLETVARLKALVKNPLNSIRIAVYPGCLSSKPPAITDEPDVDNPMHLDLISDALGARVADWSYKTRCCGGSLMMTQPDVAKKMSFEILAAAMDTGADAIVTDCPMCQTNLDVKQDVPAVELPGEKPIPIFFITELIALAIDEPLMSRLWRKHFIDPRLLLADKGLIR